MIMNNNPIVSTPQTKLDPLFCNLQIQTLNMIILILGGACVLLVGYGFQNLEAGWFHYLGFGFLIALLLAWLTRLRSFGFASVLVILSSLTAIFVAVHWGGLQNAAILLLVPSGFATLLLDIGGGSVLGIFLTVLLLWLPPSILPLPQDLRWVCVLEVWLTIGIIWLALRPLLQSVEWSWAAYEESQKLLIQARETQLRLSQALEDSATVNQQLARLNKLAQNLRQVAEEERQSKQQFVANVSHELRTPLNMIIGFCEVILKKPQAYGKHTLPPMLLADLAVVLRNSQHLSELIDDVLDLSQIDAGKMALVKERVSLKEIIDAAVEAIQPLFISKNLYLLTEVPDDLPLIYCDRTRIREVMLNLLSNAGRFTTQGGVKIMVLVEENNVTVSLTDTGTGLTPEATQKLFQPFQQADASIHQRFGGTGLGLAISKSFVELHDGRMWVESQTGVGTTFYFQLPIDPHIPLKSSPIRWLNQWAVLKERTHVPKPHSGAVKPRLMVVDQGNTLQKLLNRYIQDYEIVSSPDLDKALLDLNETPAQALLVNTLPIEEALGRLSQTNALPYSTPAIICSIPGFEQTSASLGVFDYLVKPISLETLMAALARINIPINTILLVDDEPDAIQLFRRMLLSIGNDYRILRASNGLQALEVLREEKVDIILLDLTMPEMDGFQFLAIRNRTQDLKSIPVILISARDPTGQPIASNAITVTRGGGLSAFQLMECVEAFTMILSPGAKPGYPESEASAPA